MLGEQGAKALRGGKMEDVIFAGTAGRPPLGRAEVTLTIDNNDGALPIDYTEVSITRRMFREGSSEYEINGESARLLDIQELLSDSGIGREMHVIVGQGQLDAVLQARPEDRRGFIEEAAGVLKHRKRKEKALRKLDAMQANLTRLTDLTAELRRQLKPLGRQAEIARRAQGVQAELRDSRLRLLADDLVTLRTELEREVADEEAIRARRAEVEAALDAARAREAELEAALAADAPLLARAQDTWYRLSALEERFRGTASLAAERARHLAAEPDDVRTGRDPEAMEAEAAEVREQEGTLRTDLEQRARRADRGRRRAAGARARAWPRPSGPWSPPSAPSPTAARGWPSWPARSTPCAPAPSPPATRAPGSPPPPRTPAAAPPPPRSSWTACRTRSARSTRASSASTPGTSRRSPRTRPSRRASASWSRPSATAERERSTWTARADALASASPARTAPAALLDTAAAHRRPRLARRPAHRPTRATRPRSPPPWGRPPTPSPSTRPPRRPTRSPTCAPPTPAGPRWSSAMCRTTWP